MTLFRDCDWNVWCFLWSCCRIVRVSKGEVENRGRLKEDPVGIVERWEEDGGQFWEWIDANVKKYTSRFFCSVQWLIIWECSFFSMCHCASGKTVRKFLYHYCECERVIVHVRNLDKQWYPGTIDQKFVYLIHERRKWLLLIEPCNVIASKNSHRLWDMSDDRFVYR